MVSSKSSPRLPSSRPPTSTSTSRLNTPNAPLIRISAPSLDHPVRPSRYARRYSTTWIRPSQLLGMRMPVTRPATTEHPLITRMVPPAATIRTGSSANGLVTTSSASGSSTESASMMATSASDDALTPALIASDLPEFSLRTTTSRVRPSRGTATDQIAARSGTSSGTGRSTSTRSKASASRATVSSLLPSSTTTTSCLG